MLDQTIAQIRQRIAQACARSGRDPAAVRIVAVTKNRSPDAIREVFACGILDIGENRVQEAVTKFRELEAQGALPPGLSRHMVGRLQTNKVKEAVRSFDLIHSVDSLRLAAEIGRRARLDNKVQDILLQVNTSREARKSGAEPGQAAALAAEVRAVPSVRLIGLMTMAAAADDPQQARPSFTLLRELLEEINAASHDAEPLRVLSMGMSRDYEVAVEEGATMVRIGRAIFGG